MAHARLQDITRTELSGETVGRLLRLPGDGHLILSLYLSLDPARLPNLNERREEAGALLTEAVRRSEALEDCPHEERMALRRDIERVRDLLTEDEELAPPGAHGLAIFCSETAGVFEVVHLADDVDPGVLVDRRALLEPLVERLSGERWCVALVSRRTTRIFVGGHEHLVEAGGVLDDVHGRHAQGGWSQSRYQRGVEKEADDHIRATCAVLFDRLRDRPFDRLLLAGPAELHNRVEMKLHPDLRSRLAGRFEIDVERTSAEEVHRRAAPLIEAAEQRREQLALRRLRDSLAPTDHAAVGLEEVLELLSERRVAMLLVAHGFAVAGFACPLCGRLTAGGAPCPVDGADPEPREDVVESAIALALAQAAQVLVVRHLPDELAEHGNIAALLRY